MMTIYGLKVQWLSVRLEGQRNTEKINENEMKWNFVQMFFELAVCGPGPVIGASSSISCLTITTSILIGVESMSIN